MKGVARTGSVYLTMSVTLERYFAIVRPLSSFYMKRWLVPISIVFAIFYNFPRFFELERYIFIPTNETLVRGTTLRQNQLYISIYNTWMKMVSTFPFFCMKMTGFFLPFLRIWLNNSASIIQIQIFPAFLLPGFFKRFGNLKGNGLKLELFHT